MNKRTIRLAEANKMFTRHGAWAQRYWESLIARDDDGDCLEDSDRIQIENADIESGAGAPGMNLHGAVARNCDFRGLYLNGACLAGDFRGSTFSSG